MQRPHLKGRDLYDLLWYLSDPEWPPPNLTLLNNALRQTGWEREALTAQTWRAVVRQRLESIAWEQVLADVRPFLEAGAAHDLLTPANLIKLLEGR